ncbi:MAG: chloride channel protein, partial [Thermoplasmata archaeon]|nr:chloride channel protein [Thermoplasmata archaeon]
MSTSDKLKKYAKNLHLTGNATEQTKKQRKSDIREYLLLSSLAMVVGIIVGLASIAFRSLISFTHNFFFLGEASFRYDEYQHMFFNYGWLVFIVPAIGGLLVGLLIKYGKAQEAKGHGVPEVMYAVIKNKGRIKPRIGIVKALASAITIGSGGSAGREGPAIQIGAAGGSSIGQFLGLSDEKVRILVGCGTAAGIAATFNAPIAGVVFALELILLEFKTKSFVPLVVSSVVATIIAHLFLGEAVAYPIRGIAEIYILRSPYELLLYLLLGVIAGLAALFFIKFFYKIEDFFDALKIRDYTKPMLGGLLLGIVGLLTFQIFGGYFIFGTGYGTVMPALLSENFSPDMMYTGMQLALFILLLMFLKMLATALTLGSGGSGGVFAPSLWIGAMLGAAFGVMANLVFPGIAAPFGAYALVGMAAFFAGASRATLTAIIILFEMTSTYEIILPLMFACVVADAVSRILSKDTIYTFKMRKKGVRYSYDREINVLETCEVGEVMVKDVECITGDMTLGQISEKILLTGYQGFPYLDGEGKLCGIITHSDVKEALKKGTPSDTPFCKIKSECKPEIAY